MTDYSPPPRDLPPGSFVWAYLRDSGGAAQENSVTQQEAEIRAYCVRYSLVLVEIFRDVAKSGGSVIGRDGFEHMIEMSESKDIRPRGLLIWNLARFARDTIDSNYYKATLRKRGIIIHSITDPIPDNDQAGRIVETVIDLANEEKRRQTSRDVKRGLKSLVSQGYAPGTPPKGYARAQVTIGTKRDGSPRIVSKWVPDLALWESVILAWQMRAAGKSYRDIQEATGGRIYKSIPCWHTFFKNKAYLGIGISGDYEKPDHHEPAITWEVWEAVQKLREDNPLRKDHPQHPRRVGSPSLLTGFTYCLECGAMMTHNPGYKLKPWHFYACGRKHRQGNKACSSKRVGEKHAENAILNFVINQVLSPGYLEDVIEHARAQFGDTSDLERQIALAQRKLQDLEIRIQRTLNAIDNGSRFALDHLKQHESEHAQVKTEISNIESLLAAAKVEITPDAMLLMLEAWREQITKAREINDVKFIRTWLTHFVSKVELGYNRARIHYTYPIKNFSPRNNRNVYPHLGGTRVHHC